MKGEEEIGGEKDKRGRREKHFLGDCILCDSLWATDCERLKHRRKGKGSFLAVPAACVFPSSEYIINFGFLYFLSFSWRVFFIGLGTQAH